MVVKGVEGIGNDNQPELRRVWKGLRGSSICIEDIERSWEAGGQFCPFLLWFHKFLKLKLKLKTKFNLYDNASTTAVEFSL